TIGRPDGLVAVTGGLEFSAVIGPARTRISAEDFHVDSVTSDANHLNVLLQQRNGGLKAKVEYRLGNDDFFGRKTITFTNGGVAPIQLLDVDVESLQFGNARALGL